MATPNTNGLMSGSSTMITGDNNSNIYVKRQGNGDVVIEGDLAISGDLAIGAGPVYSSYLALRPNANIVLAPSTNVGMPNTDFTIPAGFSGYWGYTLSITIVGPSGVTADDHILFSADETAGFYVGIPGSIVTYHPRSAITTDNTVVSGVFFQRFTAGQTIRFYQEQAGTFAIGSGIVKVAYTYLGDNGAFAV
jgi:hypothetical protein